MLPIEGFPHRRTPLKYSKKSKHTFAVSVDFNSQSFVAGECQWIKTDKFGKKWNVYVVSNDACPVKISCEDLKEITFY